MNSKNQRIIIIFIILIVYMIVPFIGSKLYFRHDDSILLLWSKDFTQPAYQAFFTEDGINTFTGYPGMDCYWRPVSYLFLKMLWTVFGTNPSPYFIINGFIFILTIFLFFKIIERRAGLYAAGLGALFYLVTFHTAIYNLFRIVVPIGYLFQLATVLFAYYYLVDKKWPYLPGLFLCLVPAMARQTTAVILFAVFLVIIFEQRKKHSYFSKRNIFVFISTCLSIFLLSFTSLIKGSGLFTLLPDINKMFQFFLVRFMFYGQALTKGILGLIVLTAIGGRSLKFVFNLLRKTSPVFRSNIALIFLTLITTGLFLKLPALSPYWLTLNLINLLVFDQKSRFFVAWAAISILAFTSAGYYHQGYLLEAAFPLSAIIGITVYDWYNQLREFTDKKVFFQSQKFKIIISCFLISACGLLIIKRDIILEKGNSLNTFISNNKIFAGLMNYLEHEQPENTYILELSKEDIGILIRRDFTLLDRAKKTKIMDIKDKRNMLKVLNRGDLKIVPSNAIDDPRLPEKSYFIALNSFERKIAESSFKLQLIREFRDKDESAAIYSIIKSESHKSDHLTIK